MQPVRSYIPIQATICAVINMIVNPTMSWLGNPTMQFTPLIGIVIDMTITCIIMSTGITFFTASGVKRDLKAGNIKAGEVFPGTAGFLLRLPRSWWFLGLLLGFIFAVILVPSTIGIFSILGFAGLTFKGLVIFKIVYTGSLAFVVTGLVILRQISEK